MNISYNLMYVSIFPRWGISSPSQVNFGGIIIGRDATLVHCTQEQYTEGRNLATQAFRIRKKRFYEPSGIRVWTWDRVLEIAENQTASHQEIMGDPSGVTDVTASRPSAPLLYTESPTTAPPE